MWYSCTVIPSNWIMTIGIRRDGSTFKKCTLIDKRRMKSTTFRLDKHCLPEAVSTKLAMVKMMRGSYEVSIIGAWLGEQIMAVALDKDEYNNLLGMTYGNTGEQGKEKRIRNTGEVSERVQDNPDDGGLR